MVVTISKIQIYRTNVEYENLHIMFYPRPAVTNYVIKYKPLNVRNMRLPPCRKCWIWRRNTVCIHAHIFSVVFLLHIEPRRRSPCNLETVNILMNKFYQYFNCISHELFCISFSCVLLWNGHLHTLRYTVNVYCKLIL